MANSADIARLQTLLKQDQGATPAQAQRIVNDNKDFLERMTAEMIQKTGGIPPRMAAIAREFGIKY